jgi:hypothetical protein
MSLYATINEEVQSVLRENEQKKVIGALSQILSDPSTQIPKLEKFVKTNLPQLIAAFKEAPIQKEVRDDEDTIPFGEAPDDDVEARVRDARNKAVGTAKAAVKGAVGDVAVASSRTMATVISRLPGGKRWLAPLLGAIFDPTTNKAAKNFAIFAIANLLAGPEINPLLSADLGDVLQSIGGVDWDRLNVVDDVALLSMAKKGLKDSGTDLNKATKRFLAFAQGKENPEKADAARKERNAAFQAKIDKAREKNNPKSPEDAWASDFEANLNKDKGPKYDTPVVPRRRVKGPVPTDAPMFQATTGKRRKRKEESIMKKSALMKIIREEVEVVLTNKEASEIFDLDLDRLNEIARPSFKEMWNLLSQWIEDQGIPEKSPEYDQEEKEFLAQHGWDQGKFDAAADRARESGDIAFLEEAWKGDPEINQTGEYADKTKDELCAMKKSLMDKESRTEAEQKKVRQINFALRSKQKGPKFGKVGC